MFTYHIFQTDILYLKTNDKGRDTEWFKNVIVYVLNESE